MFRSFQSDCEGGIVKVDKLLSFGKMLRRQSLRCHFLIIVMLCPDRYTERFQGQPFDDSMHGRLPSSSATTPKPTQQPASVDFANDLAAIVSSASATIFSTDAGNCKPCTLRKNAITVLTWLGEEIINLRGDYLFATVDKYRCLFWNEARLDVGGGGSVLYLKGLKNIDQRFEFSPNRCFEKLRTVKRPVFVTSHSEVIVRFERFSLHKLPFLLRNVHRCSLKAFAFQMRPQPQEI